MLSLNFEIRVCTGQGHGQGGEVSLLIWFSRRLPQRQNGLVASKEQSIAAASCQKFHSRVGLPLVLFKNQRQIAISQTDLRTIMCQRRWSALGSGLQLMRGGLVGDGLTHDGLLRDAGTTEDYNHRERRQERNRAQNVAPRTSFRQPTTIQSQDLL